MSNHSTNRYDRQNKELLAEFQNIMRRETIQRQAREQAVIDADPKANRDTTLMGDAGLRYGYWACSNGLVRYCYATTKNAAGYWLTWTETEQKDGTGVRTLIRGHKRRKDAKESARKGYENDGRI